MKLEKIEEFFKIFNKFEQRLYISQSKLKWPQIQNIPNHLRKLKLRPYSRIISHQKSKNSNSAFTLASEN
jgi:hypothetical protein